MKRELIKKFFAECKGQVWVETVIYTLIAFIMIGVVLSFVKPKIEEFQDKALIEQSINMINQIDTIIREIDKRGAGNQREIKLDIKKGELKISGVSDRIVFDMTGRYQYTEAGSNYTEGDLFIKTDKKGDLNEIEITRDYSLYNVTYEQQDEIKTITSSPTAYTVLISNDGKDYDGKTRINFELK
jgi:hypothetical protein